MCGICGVFNFDPAEPVDPAEIREMAATIVHRGPDEDGFYVNRNVGMGMRRLSIIDLTDGRQPISNEDKTVHVIYNGEIYNYRELRADLVRAGHRFRSHVDTEVIAHAYEEYGDGFVDRLNGMFAFALWDERRRLLLLVRDRIGIKPLYYYADSRRLGFSSELRALLATNYLERRIDPRALDCLLNLEYVPAPLTILQGVQKLPAGCLLRVTPQGAGLQQYWDVDYGRITDRTSAELEEGLLERLQRAVSRQLVSDVPLGAFLSGGIDSSLVVALMCQTAPTKVKTFSIGFPAAGYDERDHARAVARHLGTDHHEIAVDPNDRNLIKRAILSLDEPLADASIVPTLLVSKLAREHVKVALSGDGGDELFAGYDSYRADRAAQLYSSVPGLVRGWLIEPVIRRLPQTSRRLGAINSAKGLLKGLEQPLWLEHARWLTYLSAVERAHLYTPEFVEQLDGHDCHTSIRQHLAACATSDRLGRQLYADLKTYLVDDVLAKVDRMSMAVSLEVRPPLLDHEVVEYVATIPSGMKLGSHWRSKYILKQIARRFLPDAIVNRRKSGFSMPVKNWLRRELKPMLLDVIESGSLNRHGQFFTEPYIRRLVVEHDTMRANHSHVLWTLLVLGLWCDEYLRSQSPSDRLPALPNRSESLKAVI